jgi:chromosomal replication initiation ATPase DnaA
MTEQEELIELRQRIETLEKFVLRVNYKLRDENLQEKYQIIQEGFREFFNVDLGRKDRSKDGVKARQMYYQYMRLHTGLSLYNLPRTIGLDHDHSTIIYHLKQFDDNVTIDRDYRKDWIDVNNFINQKFTEHGK